MNLPNKLTLFRVCTIPFFVVFMEFSILGEFDKFIAVALFIIASITDALDGYIARKYNLVTNFGKFMDPLADKLLVSAALICLGGRIPAWIIVVIISRELIISGFRIIAADSGVVIAASYWGKVKTVFQMIMIIWLILDLNSFVEKYIIDLPIYDIVGNILIAISLILTVISMIDYFAKNKQVLKDEK
ncbi:MAG: CDP-diacylglycerol--glycerol-3-phosphate 3-phosphatidyltransferase [Lachnospiraceae bacterium]|nr:CDP-diacylglycerol--glycerol-3-phosphate 3-phosphatidyltransferase [Lachnospiraceae bacterium]